MATRLLAIETSCDETGLAVVEQRGSTITVLANELASQTDIHALTGGVVPNVAAREHLAVMQPLLRQTLETSNTDRNNLDAIAITVGPGLMPALVIGVQAAKALSFAWDKPLVPVNHLEGHLYSALLSTVSSKRATFNSQVQEHFPALALLVSGGHTMLVLMTDHLSYQVIGQTRDDAAGEAFDKVARLLGLPYPGGPALSRLAGEGNSDSYDFTRPMMNSGDLDFSFSGLKTDVLYTVRNLDQATQERERANLAASFQAAAVEALVYKTKQALAKHSPRTLLLAGGVAANQLLRQKLKQLAEAEQVPLRIAPLDLCGDNGVMIGLAGLRAFQAKRTTPWPDLDATARLSLDSLPTPQLESTPAH